MGKAERDKGLRGEREVRHEFESAGFVVRGLEGEGDNLVFVTSGITLHVETKRQETLKLPLWIRQAEAEAPEQAVPIVVYRKSRDEWSVDLRLSEFLAILQLARRAPS